MLGLAHAVAADEDGKVGEFLGCEGRGGLVLPLEFDSNWVSSGLAARVAFLTPASASAITRVKPIATSSQMPV